MTKQEHERFRCDISLIDFQCKNELSKHVCIKHVSDDYEIKVEFIPETNKAKNSDTLIDETEKNYNSINKLIFQLKSVDDIQSGEVLTSKSQLTNTYPCDKCNYIAKQKGHLKRHKEAKHELHKISCDMCDKSFSTKEIVKRHVTDIHNRYMLKCDSCDFESARKEALKNHKLTKHSKQMFNCHKCQYHVMKVSALPLD